MTSSECLRIKDKYENIKGKIQNAIGYIDECSDSILDSASYLKDLIIDDKTFDDGKLYEDNARLSDVKGNLQAIINECNEKISYYEKLYNDALSKERTLAANKNTNEKNDDSSFKLPIKSTDIHMKNMG